MPYQTGAMSATPASRATPQTASVAPFADGAVLLPDPVLGHGAGPVAVEAGVADAVTTGDVSAAAADPLFTIVIAGVYKMAS